MTFTRGTQKEKNIFKIGGIPLENTREYKYIGILLNKKNSTFTQATNALKNTIQYNTTDFLLRMNLIQKQNENSSKHIYKKKHSLRKKYNNIHRWFTIRQGHPEKQPKQVSR